MTTPAPQATGILHFIQHTDVTGQTLFAILLLMSVLSWYFILSKLLRQRQQSQRSQQFENLFWNASSFEKIKQELAAHGAQEPFAHMTRHALFAREQHARIGSARFAEAGTPAEFLTRTLRKVVDEETAHLEQGLTTLGTIGATAPFVGLFGTVWGVYHALTAIGMSGSAGLDQVAGPVGEALIMTGLGLAVAIPAVIGFNAINRRNRVYLSRLDAFAHDLFSFLTTGQSNTAAASTHSNVAPLRHQS